MPSESLEEFRSTVPPTEKMPEREPKRRVPEKTVPMPVYKDGRARRSEKVVPMPILESADDL